MPERDETFGLIVQASPTDPIDTFLASATFTIKDETPAIGANALPIRLPFDSHGVAIAVTQKSGGDTSHTGPLYTSWDFALAYGTPVLAVAGGTVVDIRETVPDGSSFALPDSDGDGNPLNDAPSLGSGAIGNLVTVRHIVNGQTFYATYMHLQESSIPVAIGDVVSAGQTIGILGNTGARTGTHLHFQVGSTSTSFGSTNYGGGTGDNAIPQTIADANSAQVGLVSFDGYGVDLPPTVIGPPISNGVPGTIYGSDGADTLPGGRGVPIDGGAGIDTVVYSGNHGSITHNPDGTYTVGTDTLSNVERLQFADITIALDSNGNAGQVYRLYQAAFNRTPDKGGLGDWIYGMDHGMSLLDVSAGFVNSLEFGSVYGQNPTNAEVVTRFYQNVLHRAPEQAGFDYWMNQIESGLQTRTQVLTGFSESPENQLQVIGVIQNGFEYTQHSGATTTTPTAISATEAVDGHLLTSSLFAQAAYRDGTSARSLLATEGWRSPSDFYFTSGQSMVVGSFFDIPYTAVGFAGNASAILSEKAVSGGQRELHLAFAGTDTAAGAADFANDLASLWGGSASAYNTVLYGFMQAVRQYVGDHSNQISRVYVTGHSLGGTAAEEFLREVSTDSITQGDSLYWGVTFGSPGAGWAHTASQNSNHRLLQIEHVDFNRLADPIAALPFIHTGDQLRVDYGDTLFENLEALAIAITPLVSTGAGLLVAHRLDAYQETARYLDAASSDAWNTILNNNDYQEVALIGTNGTVEFQLG